MKTAPITIEDLRGVFALPPLARRDDQSRSLNFGENDRIVKHIVGGGVRRFIYESSVEFRRALEIEPLLLTSNRLYGLSLLYQGKPKFVSG